MTEEKNTRHNQMEKKKRVINKQKSAGNSIVKIKRQKEKKQSSGSRVEGGDSE